MAVTAGNTQFFKRPDALPVAHSTQSRQTSGQKSVEKSTGYGSKIRNIIRITLKSSVSEILDTKNLTIICSQILLVIQLKLKHEETTTTRTKRPHVKNMLGRSIKDMLTVQYMSTKNKQMFDEFYPFLRRRLFACANRWLVRFGSNHGCRRRHAQSRFHIGTLTDVAVCGYCITRNTHVKTGQCGCI